MVIKKDRRGREEGRLCLGVLISGRGSNLQAIVENIDNNRLDAEVSIVISSSKDAMGLEFAEKRGLPAFYVERKASKKDYEGEIVSILEKHDVELVVLAGYMHIVGPTILKKYVDRVLNIHPSLLPAFPGLQAQKQALDYGVRFSGCTVHFVDMGMDTGPILLQAVVPVRDDDTQETLSRRILLEEHVIYSQAIQLIAEGRAKIKGRRVQVRKA